MTKETTKINLTVNGVVHTLEITPDAKLADVLRRDPSGKDPSGRGLGLTGTKIGCGDGQCGSCVVLLDGKPVRSCVYPARRAEGKRVLTVEGLAATWGQADELHPLQKAFIEHGAIQCGFCTPGLLLAAAGLWHKMAGSVPTDDEIKRALARNACRCTGYASVLRAVRSAFHEARSSSPLPPTATETMEPLRVIGRSYPRPDAVAKVTGAAKFADDYAFPGMLYGATLRAGHPHARILTIDTSRAAALPGVHAVLTHRDVPGRNRHGLVYADWPVLCDDKVRYLGDAVAIVAADTPEIADEALTLIKVEYEPLPVVASAEQARQPDAAIVHEEWEPTADGGGGNLLEHIKVRLGDVAQGFAEADVIVEGEYRTPTYDHLFMEPECSIGLPAGYDAADQGRYPKLTVYVGSQIPYADRDQIAAALDLPPDQVRVVGTLIGGGFGGKEDIMGQIHAALLAQASGRPVKVLYDRAESLLAHPKRHATVIRIKTGARRDGRLVAVQAELIGDAGAYASLSTKVLKRATTHATGPYHVPNAKVDCYAMYTNNPPSGAFRGFGVTQSAFAVESNMDILAHELGLDPFELRRVNALRIGATTATGQILRESVGLLDCLDWVESRVQELEAAPLPDTRYPNTRPPAPQIAWGLACAYKNTGFGGGAPDEASAEVEVYPDGTVTGTDAEVRASSADLGQGLTTVLAQIAAEELGLPFERVRVLLSDTDLTPDGGPTTASRQTFVTGNAARHAAEGLRRRLSYVAAERWDVPPETIRFEDGELRAAAPASLREASPPRAGGTEGGPHSVLFGQAVEWLIDEGREPRLTYRYAAPATQPLGEGGDMHFAFGFGVQAAQVAVDEKTGKVQVLRVVAAADGGRALNPQAFLGQIEGGIVMGIGTALTEEYVLEEGIPRTRRWKDYKTPLIGDAPEMDVHLAEHPTTTGPYGAKGIGELPSIPTAPAICNAIYNATGVRVYELPAKLKR